MWVSFEAGTNRGQPSHVGEFSGFVSWVHLTHTQCTFTMHETHPHVVSLFGRPLFTYLLLTLTEGDKRGDLRCA